MRAVTIADKALKFSVDSPEPEPGLGEVLVKVHAAGLNGADLLQVRGAYPAPPGSPADIPGLELAGEVVGLGPGVGRFGIGDRVMGIVGGGGQAEYAVVHERQLMPVPAGLDLVAAGGFPETFTTAHDAIVVQAGLRPGERLLVHGAAGGVGTAAVQIGRAIGASVVATTRHEQFDAQLEQLGAEVVTRPNEHHGFGPFDVVLELIGGENLGEDVKALATGGRVVIVGVGGGIKAELNLLALMSVRGRVLGTTLRSRPLEEKAATARAMEREVLPLVERGRLTVPIAKAFPAEEAEAAYAHFKQGGKFGKVILTF
ncbi:MAG: zinc-binding dehydrogenase [Solirubrobacteraceae bacterium]|nr:zinc-binding dehydrogenase [Solirubrobacteraceae bacterium]